MDTSSNEQSLKLQLTQFREVEGLTDLGNISLSAATLRRITRGTRLIELLKQNRYKPVRVEHQILLFYGVNRKFHILEFCFNRWYIPGARMGRWGASS